MLFVNFRSSKNLGMAPFESVMPQILRPIHIYTQSQKKCTIFIAYLVFLSIINDSNKEFFIAHTHNIIINHYKLVLIDGPSPLQALAQQQAILASRPTDLASLLAELGLSKYLSVFEKEEVNLQVFLSLTDNDLKEVGIK